MDLGYYVFLSRDYQSLIRGGHNFNQLTFSDKPIFSNDSNGFTVTGTEISINNCIASDNGTNGIVTTLSVFSTISNCVSRNNGAQGYSIDGSDTLISECISYSNTDEGFQGGGGNNNLYIGCYSEGNSQGFVTGTSHDETMYVGCYAINNSNVGFFNGNVASLNSTYKSCFSVNNGTYGFYINAGNKVTIENCTILNNTSFEIFIDGGSDNVKITNCTISDISGGSGIELDDNVGDQAQNIVSQGNTFSGLDNEIVLQAGQTTEVDRWGDLSEMVGVGTVLIGSSSATARVGWGTDLPVENHSFVGNMKVTGLVVANAFEGDGSALTNLPGGGGGGGSPWTDLGARIVPATSDLIVAASNLIANSIVSNGGIDGATGLFSGALTGGTLFGDGAGITNLEELIDDQVNTLVVGDATVLIVYDDGANTLTWSIPPGTFYSQSILDTLLGLKADTTIVNATFDGLDLEHIVTSWVFDGAELKPATAGLTVSVTTLTADTLFGDGAGITNLEEIIDDQVNVLIVGDTTVSIIYNDGGGTLTFSIPDSIFYGQEFLDATLATKTSTLIVNASFDGLDTTPHITTSWVFDGAELKTATSGLTVSVTNILVDTLTVGATATFQGVAVFTMPNLGLKTSTFTVNWSDGNRQRVSIGALQTGVEFAGIPTESFVGILEVTQADPGGFNLNFDPLLNISWPNGATHPIGNASRTLFSFLYDGGSWLAQGVDFISEQPASNNDLLFSAVGNMIFTTANTERMRITSAGQTIIKLGTTQLRISDISGTNYSELYSDGNSIFITSSSSDFTGLLVGENDTVNGLGLFFGQTTGSANGGQLRVHTAADHDTTIDYFLFNVINDDLEIGPVTDPSSLKYDGTLDAWIISSAFIGVLTGTPTTELEVNGVAAADSFFTISESGAKNDLGIVDRDVLRQEVRGMVPKKYTRKIKWEYRNPKEESDFKDVFAATRIDINNSTKVIGGGLEKTAQEQFTEYVQKRADLLVNPNYTTVRHGIYLDDSTTPNAIKGVDSNGREWLDHGMAVNYLLAVVHDQQVQLDDKQAQLDAQQIQIDDLIQRMQALEAAP